ncbi:hypothetical protein FHW84_003147 [Dyella sp. SG562]|uniref:hypothetical protein n=1 Tax=Dyella sp. SG562 TaxID=2587017 RepID=UPI0014218053|nr:hypothetical protein [Dyella sp. SG562]NII74557.1 hypothetical protein [Dyella sp. SG562]
MRVPFLFALTLLGGAASAAEAPSPIQAMQPLLGSWHCAGVFPASGKKIASTMRFDTELGGAGVLKHHDDIAPNTYRAVEAWTYDAKGRQFNAAIVDNFGGARRFSADGWEGDTLTWTSAPEVQPAQKFVYVRMADGGLRVDWQVMRGGSFVVGDTLSCKRP